ncbi:sensor histidine kinase [Lysobacter sp. A3-1-A15]|uniref:sensor histidine kinase n=1 Tax=Novilysobacter viscosus TaxID=3098602 RepID=UPI002EDA1C4D
MRRWLGFAACVALLFASLGLLLLFLLEDSFIDRQLEAAARSVSSATPGVTRLPAGFSVYRLAEVPLDIHARLPFVEAGEPFEMRRADRRYVHLLLVDTPHRGRLVVVYDVTDQLTVTPQLGTGLLLVLGLTALTLLAAAALAQAFVGRVTRQAAQVIDDVRKTPDPARLRELAQAQPILEFRRLLEMHADVWKAQLVAVEHERQALAYLGHELRTPLQSARTSLALLQDSPRDRLAQARLSRAIARLGRAAHAVLWLATDREPGPAAVQPVLPLVRALVDELGPMAASVAVRISVDLRADLVFRGPVEVAEVILANLLLNAIQHGTGAVHIGGVENGVVITNTVVTGADAPGFGFGRGIVDRLASRVGWHVELLPEPGRMCIHIGFS